MSRNIFEPTPWRAIHKNQSAIKTTHQKPGAFKWWEPDCDETDEDEAAAGCTGDEPALVNGWAQPVPADGLQKFAFRLHSDGSLEFRGHLDASGAASDTVAFTLPGTVAGEAAFLDGFTDDQFFLTVIWDGATAQPAMVYIDRVTGDVTITFPV